MRRRRPTAASASLSTPAADRSAPTSSCSPSATSTPSPTDAAPSSPRFAADHGLRLPAAGHTAELDLSALRRRRRRHRARLRPGLHRPRRPAHRGPRRPLRRRRRRRAALRAERRRAGPPRRLAARRAVPLEDRLPPAGRAGAAAAVPRRRRRSTPCSPRDGRSTSARDVLPLVPKEVGWAYYHELFNAHPERTTHRAGTTFAERVRRRLDRRRGRRRGRRRAAPTPTTSSTSTGSTDRSPGCGSRRAPTSCSDHVRDHIAADVARRTDPTYSADLGAFNALLRTFGAIGRLARRAACSPTAHASRTSTAGGSASSCTTPAVRRRPACASCSRWSDAGLVRFIGAGTTVHGDADAGRFVATQHEPSRARSAHGALDRRGRRRADAQPHRRRAAAAAARPRRGRARRSSPTASGAPNTGKVVVAGPALLDGRADGRRAPPPPRRRQLHQPPGGRRVLPAADQRAGVPPERRGGPRAARASWPPAPAAALSGDPPGRRQPEVLAQRGAGVLGAQHAALLQQRDDLSTKSSRPVGVRCGARTKPSEPSAWTKSFICLGDLRRRADERQPPGRLDDQVADAQVLRLGERPPLARPSSADRGASGPGPG